MFVCEAMMLARETIMFTETESMMFSQSTLGSRLHKSKLVVVTFTTKNDCIKVTINYN